MSVTRSLSLSLRIHRLFGPVIYVLLAADVVLGQGSLPSAVGSQANTDASAQRRLQETAREAQRQRRIEELVLILAPALDATKLAGPTGPSLTRKALAALTRLREEGISADDALARAGRMAKTNPAQVAKPTVYLRNLFSEKSSALNDGILEKLEAGEDPAPSLILPPYLP